LKFQSALEPEPGVGLPLNLRPLLRQPLASRTVRTLMRTQSLVSTNPLFARQRIGYGLQASIFGAWPSRRWYKRGSPQRFRLASLRAPVWRHLQDPAQSRETSVAFPKSPARIPKGLAKSVGPLTG
jgi:hypothetical protein